MTERSLKTAKKNMLDVMGDMMLANSQYTEEELENLEIALNVIDIATSRIRGYIQESRETKTKTFNKSAPAYPGRG